MTELFTLLLQTFIGPLIISCASPDISHLPGEPHHPVAYACVIQVDDRHFVATGGFYEVRPEDVPRLDLSGDEL